MAVISFTAKKSLSIPFTVDYMVVLALVVHQHVVLYGSCKQAYAVDGFYLLQLFFVQGKEFPFFRHYPYARVEGGIEIFDQQPQAVENREQYRP